MGTRQLEIEHNQNIWLQNVDQVSKKNSKKVKKTLAFYARYDIIIVYDKEKNTTRENKRR